LVEELLGKGYEVVGVDNHSKNGPITKSYDLHPNCELAIGDARDVDLMTAAMMDREHIIAGAAPVQLRRCGRNASTWRGGSSVGQR
jgi:nucleoside-diphosphate-sugar epimerase